MTKKDFFLLFIILTVNLSFRLYRLDYGQGPIFDEKAYYLDAARSYIEDRDDPNIEHPPLGKILIASGIRIFGDNPYGWRLPSLIFSLFGIALTYLLAKELFVGKFVPVLSAGLLSIDNLFFIHSRLAVPEMFLLTFSLGVMFFLWRYFREGRGVDLWLMALSFGGGLATKWTIVFLLPTVFFFLYRRGGRRSLLKESILLLTVSSILYLAVYFPYIRRHSFWRFIALQQTMFGFWKNFEAKANFDPVSYFLNHAVVWIFNPGWNYDVRIEGGRIAVINALFNPVLYWVSLYFVVKMVFSRRRGGDLKNLFLIFPIAANFLPWLLVKRVQYLYYFLSALPFLCLITACQLESIWRKNLEGRYKAAWVMITAVAAFIVFYPMSSSLPVSKRYLSPLSVSPLTVTTVDGSGNTRGFTLR